jgi:hypothetical protein
MATCVRSIQLLGKDADSAWPIGDNALKPPDGDRSPLMPRTHFSSHWVYCGHTRPQMAEGVRIG